MRRGDSAVSPDALVEISELVSAKASALHAAKTVLSASMARSLQASTMDEDADGDSDDGVVGKTQLENGNAGGDANTGYYVTNAHGEKLHLLRHHSLDGVSVGGDLDITAAPEQEHAGHTGAPICIDTSSETLEDLRRQHLFSGAGEFVPPSSPLLPHDPASSAFLETSLHGQQSQSLQKRVPRHASPTASTRSKKMGTRDSPPSSQRWASGEDTSDAGSHTSVGSRTNSLVSSSVDGWSLAGNVTDLQSPRSEDHDYRSHASWNGLWEGGLRSNNNTAATAAGGRSTPRRMQRRNMGAFSPSSSPSSTLSESSVDAKARSAIAAPTAASSAGAAAMNNRQRVHHQKASNSASSPTASSRGKARSASITSTNPGRRMRSSHAETSKIASRKREAVLRNSEADALRAAEREIRLQYFEEREQDNAIRARAARATRATDLVHATEFAHQRENMVTNPRYANTEDRGQDEEEYEMQTSIATVSQPGVCDLCEHNYCVRTGMSTLRRSSIDATTFFVPHVPMVQDWYSCTYAYAFFILTRSLSLLKPSVPPHRCMYRLDDPVSLPTRRLQIYER